MIKLILLSLVAIISIFLVIRSLIKIIKGSDYIFDHALCSFIFLFIGGFAINGIISLIQNINLL
jgi:hypothetical protein